MFYIFVVEFISESARNEVTIEFEANLNNGIIDDSLAFERVIEIRDNFACKFDYLVQWMEFSDLVDLISEDLDFVLKVYFQIIPISSSLY